MIKKINSVKNFGVYQHFSWGSLPEFRPQNVIYGWNYSGKTTLSRLFSSLRDREIHPDFPGAEFKLQLSDGTELTQNTIATCELPILVFNSEYIRTNLKWETNDSIAGITFDVGESVGVREQIQRNLEQIDKVQGTTETRSRLEPYQNTIAEFALFDSTKFTNAARSIKNDVFNSLIDFDKRHFNSIKNQIISNLPEHRIDDEDELNRIKKIALANNDKEVMTLIVMDFNLYNVYDRVNEALTREPEQQHLIELLDANFSIAEWSRKGLELHNEMNECGFCGNPISGERLNLLNSYFSNASSILRNELNSLREIINELLVKIEELEIPKSKNDFFEFFQDHYERQISELPQAKAEIRTLLEYWLDLIKLKEEKQIFIAVRVKEFDQGPADQFTKWIADTNLIIAEHNRFIENFDEARETARTQLKKHQVADFLMIENYLSLEKEKNLAERCISKYNSYVKRLHRKNLELEAQLKSIVAGKQELNDFIQRFLNRDDIIIDVVEDDKFVLKRGNSIAKNLSEGEKTAISFSYFLVFLESLCRQDRLKEYVIFIDDPISSLDGNHIAQIYSLINSFFFRQGLNPDNLDQYVSCFKQIFISTHNFEFFSFLKDSHRLKDVEFYFVKRLNAEQSELQILPKSLKKYKSEYAYLFELIYSFYESGCQESDVNLVLLPNAIRRFLEIYTLMKLPHSTDQVDNRIRALYPDHGELKNLHHFSHFTSFEKLTKHDELLMNIPKAVNELIEILEYDLTHYASLKTAIGR